MNTSDKSDKTDNKKEELEKKIYSRFQRREKIIYVQFLIELKKIRLLDEIVQKKMWSRSFLLNNLIDYFLKHTDILDSYSDNL